MRKDKQQCQHWVYPNVRIIWLEFKAVIIKNVPTRNYTLEINGNIESPSKEIEDTKKKKKNQIKILKLKIK